MVAHDVGASAAGTWAPPAVNFANPDASAGAATGQPTAAVSATIHVPRASRPSVRAAASAAIAATPSSAAKSVAASIQVAIIAHPSSSFLALVLAARGAATHRRSGRYRQPDGRGAVQASPRRARPATVTAQSDEPCAAAGVGYTGGPSPPPHARRTSSSRDSEEPSARWYRQASQTIAPAPH